MACSVTLIDPYDGGHHYTYAKLLSLGLYERGFKVSIIGSSKLISDIERVAPFSYKKELEIRTSNIKILDFIFKFDYLIRAQKIAKDINADCIHFLQLDGFIIPFYLYNLFFKSKKIFASLHWLYFIEEFIEKGMLRRIKSKLQKYFFFKIIRKNFFIFVHSKLLAEKLYFNENIISIPYPIEDFEFLPILNKNNYSKLEFKKEMPDDAVLLLCFGGTRYDKGVDIALKTLMYLPSNVFLLIAGKEEYFNYEDIIKLSTKLNVRDRVLLNLSFISDIKMYEYFCFADIILLPYRKPFSGQSGPLMTAAYIGKKIIATDILVLREYIDKYNLGIVSPDGNEKSLSVKINELIKSDNISKTSKFRIDHSADKFLTKTTRAYERKVIIE
jgi:glycosyltransferase involved in cell wall biosynthesis